MDSSAAPVPLSIRADVGDEGRLRVVENSASELSSNDASYHVIETCCGTWPPSTAFLSEAPKKEVPGCSMSRPARAALSVLCVANQSDTTQP